MTAIGEGYFKELSTPPGPTYITETALAVGAARQAVEHIRHGQPMPTQPELEYLAVREIMMARGLLALEDAL